MDSSRSSIKAIHASRAGSGLENSAVVLFIWQVRHKVCRPSMIVGVLFGLKMKGLNMIRF